MKRMLILPCLLLIFLLAPAASAEKPQTEIPGDLFLKVSSVDLSLVGDTEDIYLGVIPRELVQWESENPQVVSVENGVLTAVGVGKTTIRATYLDRQAECTAVCLAKDQEAFDKLPEDVRRAPKRLPPEVDLDAPCTFFDDTAILGSSVTENLHRFEAKNNYLGDVTFLSRYGVSLNSFVRHYKSIYYRGQEVDVESAIADCGAKRVYILMGTIDLQEPNQRSYIMESWAKLVANIREKSPGIEIVVLSNLPKGDEDKVYYSEMAPMLAEYNAKLKTFAEENDLMFLDLYYYLEDHENKMAKKYVLDDNHMNEDGSLVWTKVLRHYTQFESEGGILK